MILEVEGLSKHFGGIIALNNLSLSVSCGQIVGLIGPNGAGKTTFFNCITGTSRPDKGKVIFGEYGEDIAKFAPHTISRRGIARTFQNARVFASMSVLENVMVGTFPRTSSGIWDAIRGSSCIKEEERAVRRHSEELLRFVNLQERSYDLAASLPFGWQRRLEIARALATQPRLLLMDEPAAGMSPPEKLELLDIIRRISSKGITVLLIEHDMQLVMQICQRIIVLDSGEKICEGNPEDVRRDPRVIEAYLGATSDASSG